MTTGALDASVTIDNRLLSSSGRKDIATKFENFTDNLETAGNGIKTGTLNAGKVIYETVEVILDKGLDGNISGAVKQIDYQASQMQADNEFRARYGDLQKILNDPSVPVEKKQEALNAKHETDIKYGLAEKGSKALIYAVNDRHQGVLIDKNGDALPAEAYREGGYYEPDNTIGVNVYGIDGKVISGEKLAETKAHENAESLGLGHQEATVRGEYGKANSGWADWVQGTGDGTVAGKDSNLWLNENGNSATPQTNNQFANLGLTETKNQSAIFRQTINYLVGNPFESVRESAVEIAENGLKIIPGYDSVNYIGGYAINGCEGGVCEGIDGEKFTPQSAALGFAIGIASAKVLSVGGKIVGKYFDDVVVATKNNTTKLNNAYKTIEEFVGPNAKKITTNRGNTQIISQDLDRVVRFDLNGYKKPHINIEVRSQNINEHINLNNIKK